MFVDEFVRCLDVFFWFLDSNSWTGMSRNEWVLVCVEFCRLLGVFWCFAYETVPYAYGMRLIRVWGTLPRGYTRMIRSCPVPRTTYWCFAYESVWGCSYAYGILERGKLFW